MNLHFFSEVNLHKAQRLHILQIFFKQMPFTLWILNFLIGEYLNYIYLYSDFIELIINIPNLEYAWWIHGIKWPFEMKLQKITKF